MNSGLREFIGVALALVLPGTGGGSVGNVGVVMDDQLPWDSNPEEDKLFWDRLNVVLADKGSSGGFIIAIDVLAFPDFWKSESSSKVTHCWTLAEGGAKAGGGGLEKEEGRVELWPRADAALWRPGLASKSGVSERRCEAAMVPVNGLVLLGLGWTSDEKGFEDTGRVSCERLREGGGRVSKAGVGSRGSIELDWRNWGIGVEFRDRELVDEWKEMWSEELLDWDWLFKQEAEENGSEVSGTKGLIPNCASFRIPFVPLAWRQTHTHQQNQSKLTFSRKMKP